MARRIKLNEKNKNNIYYLDFSGETKEKARRRMNKITPRDCEIQGKRYV